MEPGENMVLLWLCGVFVPVWSVPMGHTGVHVMAYLTILKTPSISRLACQFSSDKHWCWVALAKAMHCQIRDHCLLYSQNIKPASSSSLTAEVLMSVNAFLCWVFTTWRPSTANSDFQGKSHFTSRIICQEVSLKQILAYLHQASINALSRPHTY